MLTGGPGVAETIVASGPSQGDATCSNDNADCQQEGSADQIVWPIVDADKEEDWIEPSETVEVIKDGAHRLRKWRWWWLLVEGGSLCQERADQAKDDVGDGPGCDPIWWRQWCGPTLDVHGMTGATTHRAGSALEVLKIVSG